MSLKRGMLAEKENLTRIVCPKTKGDSLYICKLIRQSRTQLQLEPTMWSEASQICKHAIIKGLNANRRDAKATVMGDLTTRKMACS